MIRRNTIHSLQTVSTALILTALVVSLPAARGEPYADAFPTIPESDWVGLRLMILPQSKSLQHFGYQELYQDADQAYTPLRYDDYAGRIVRVRGIGHGRAANGEVFDEADLQLEDTKKIIHGDLEQGCMNDVGPVSDLEKARKRYSARTLWYSDDTLKSGDRKLKIKQYLPVKVLEIVPGWYAPVPIRFIVQTKDGRRGYVDVHMSDTNVPASLQTRSRFEDTFLETDPRKTYAWTPKVWAAIESREVFVGMTAQQVRMSWGEPKETDTLSRAGRLEKWVYERGRILTLKDDRLITIRR
jgi:hypothetical protein